MGIKQRLIEAVSGEAGIDYPELCADALREIERLENEVRLGNDSLTNTLLELQGKISGAALASMRLGLELNRRASDAD